MRSVFVVPVFNQARELPALVEELRGPLACDHLLFVDDGSDDGSSELIARSGFEHLRVPTRRGIGHAIQIGVRWALDRDFEVVGMIAGNGKMLASEMPRLLAPIASGRAQFVWGSRFLPGGASPNLPGFRARAIPQVNRLVRVVTGQRVTDATCGYFACDLDLFRRARFDWQAPWLWTYGFEYYLRGQVLLDPSVRWTEVPVTMRYPPSGPYSKIPPVVGWWQMIRPWVAARIDRRGFEPPGERPL